MPQLSRGGRPPSNRDRHRQSPKVTDLSSLVRGLYRRVADRLGVDPSYVSRVARSERHSKPIADALRRELDKIMKHLR